MVWSNLKVDLTMKNLLEKSDLDSKGAGAMTFIQVNGKPMIMNVISGFITAHQVALFATMYGKDRIFEAFQVCRRCWVSLSSLAAAGDVWQWEAGT